VYRYVLLAVQFKILGARLLLVGATRHYSLACTAMISHSCERVVMTNSQESAG
jgi:hypothetical protein